MATNYGASVEYLNGNGGGVPINPEQEKLFNWIGILLELDQKSNVSEEDVEAVKEGLSEIDPLQCTYGDFRILDQIVKDFFKSNTELENKDLAVVQ